MHKSWRVYGIPGTTLGGDGGRGRDGVSMPRGLLSLRSKMGTGFHRFTFTGEFFKMRVQTSVGRERHMAQWAVICP